MEETLKSIITGGITPESVWSLLILMLVFFAVMSIRGMIIAYIDYRRVKGSTYVSLGAKIRLPTSTGAVDGEIVRISRSKVVIQTATTFEHIPISTFAASRKSILIMPLPQASGTPAS